MSHSHKKHSVPAYRDPRYFAVAAVVLALPLWVGSVLFADTVERFFSSKRLEAFHVALRGDLAYVEAQARHVAGSESLRLAIARKDRERALMILDAEMHRRGLGTMVAVDRNGVALARVPTIGSYGDYVAETQPWGREAAQGGVSVMIGKGRTYPLVMIAAAPIADGTNIRGAVYSGYRLDATYAASLAERIDDGAEVVFYSTENGMIGSSISEGDQARLLEGYLNVGSDWVQHGLPEAWIDLGGTRYFVQNVRFLDPDGVEAAIGGALVLVPVPWKIEITIPALLVALALTCISSTILPAQDRRTPFRRMLIAAIFLYAFLTLVFAGSARLDRRTIPVVPAPYVIYNSTIHFNPGANIIDLGSEQRVAIELDSGGEAINAMEVIVRFDPRKVRVEELLTTNSLCPEHLFIERTIDNVAGTITIACGVPSPGFTGTRGTIAEILFEPISEGTFSLAFDASSQVLANDGLGTNVLRQATDAAYQVRSTTALAALGRSVPVFSPTHPNPNRWYNRRSARFLWPVATGTRYFYAWDQNPRTTPSPGALVSSGKIDLNAGPDGEYYFHLVAERAGIRGPVSHTRVKIDASPPAPPSIRSSAERITVGDVVRFEFSSFDATSGLQPNYYVNIDRSIFLPTLPSVYVPFLDSGLHDVTVRVFDRAGNSSDATMEIAVGKK